jgi:hypothetical protein
VIHVAERRQRPRKAPNLDVWLRDNGETLLRRLASPLRHAARRAWEGGVLAATAVAMVAAAAVFLLIGAVELLKKPRLPAWLAYGLLGLAGAAAGFLLWRSAFGDQG